MTVTRPTAEWSCESPSFIPASAIFVNLTNATNASIADNQGLGTITNDDGVLDIPTLSEWMLLALAAMLALVAARRL